MQNRTVQILSISFFVGLLVLGVFTVLTYVGVPIHGAVLLNGAAEQSVSLVCPAPQAPDVPGAGYAFCRGMVAFVPFVVRTIGRAAPFAWYGLLSLLAYGGFLVWRYIRDSDWIVRMRWRPWKVLLLSFGVLWLLFTCLSFGTDNGRDVRQFVEPTPEAYNLSTEGLAAYRSDYDALLARGCLNPVGQTQQGTLLYTYKFTCAQASFFTRVVPQLAFVLALLLELLIAGSMVLRLLRLRFTRMLTEGVVALGVGACVWIALLWTLAVFGVYVAPLGWLLVAAVPALGWREVWMWLRRFVSHEWESEYRPSSVVPLLSWLLLSYLALNFLTVVRPFPIGWDDLGSYLNRPRLLVSYQQFIFSMSPFDWTYLTSLGFLLFGYDSVFGPTAAMMVNWAAGLLAVLVLLASGDALLGRRKGLLSALLYYSLPLVGHFSFADMKIDNAVFLMGGLGMLVLFLTLFPRAGIEDEAEPPVLDTGAEGRGAWKGYALAGVFCGFAFAIKTTAIMVLMPLAGVLLGASLHWSAFGGVAFLSFLAFTRFGGFNLSKILSRVEGTTLPADTGALALMVVCVLAGAAFIGYAAWRSRKAIRPVAISSAVFAAGFFVAVAPWILHNNIRSGNVVPQFLLGAPNNFSPTIALKGEQVADHGQPIKRLPPELQVDPAHAACNATGVVEELDRYWGFSGGWGHYITLPWRTVMNTDSWGYYVTTMPALLLFPLVLLLPFFWLPKGKWLRWMTVATGFMILEWILLANGVPWYGLGMFFGLVLVLEAFTVRAPDALSRWVAAVLISCSLLTNFAARFWQFEQQRNILDYPLGKISATSLEASTIPHYNAIRQEVGARAEEFPDRPYLYRVGTFIPYFIPRNLETIGLNDHQLDMFNCINQERNHALTTKRLKALGFNAVIFDTNTATIEQDEKGTLHQKVNAFEAYVNDPASGVQVLLNDPGNGVAFIAIP